MSRYLLWIAPLLLTAATAQEETPLFRTGVSLVKVDAQVKDRTGKDIPGLGAKDFVVYDEGQPQPITDFGAEGEPVSVLLLLDVSGSMSKYLSDLGTKSTELLRALRRGDQIGLMNFATRSEMIRPLTQDTAAIGAQITSSIFKQTLGQDTFVNEALMDATRYLSTLPGKGRRAILIVTDNEGGQKAIKSAEVTQAMHAANILLSAVLVGSAAGPYSPPKYQNPLLGPPDIHRYAADTGGLVVTGASPGEALRPILKDLTTRYSLQYTAPAAEDGTFRGIRVELSPTAAARYPGARITARSGYTAGQVKANP